MEVVSFTLRPLYAWEKSRGTHWIRGWVGTTADLDAVAKAEIPGRTENRTPVLQTIS
jgi:hypothetical protein